MRSEPWLPPWFAPSVLGVGVPSKPPGVYRHSLFVPEAAIKLQQFLALSGSRGQDPEQDMGQTLAPSTLSSDDDQIAL
ncbi:hypothetical protein NXS19_005011 [Fusarium pseudograminearum]|nr:hypothetical protein NXS19_005011 [Fusarium pseudograminearum]